MASPGLIDSHGLFVSDNVKDRGQISVGRVDRENQGATDDAKRGEVCTGPSLVLRRDRTAGSARAASQPTDLQHVWVTSGMYAHCASTDTPVRQRGVGRSEADAWTGSKSADLRPAPRLREWSVPFLEPNCRLEVVVPRPKLVVAVTTGAIPSTDSMKKQN